jgi:phosphoenolpyruvate carboxykinase (ATP)
VADDVDEPDFETVQIPEWDDGRFHDSPPADRDAKILVDPDEGTTVVLGSDYTGEAKKSFLRNFMYDVKEELDGLGLHAGSKQVTYASGDGTEMNYQVFAGLSGTGKTTLSAIPPENGTAEVVQDDVIGLLPPGYDGDTVIGTERGMYAKTNGLTAEQASLYEAAQHPRTVQENVAAGGDFTDTDLTVNGRAAIPRDLLDHAADTIDMPRVDEFFHITRNPLMPPVARLTPEQSAAFFALGESVETGAGDEDSIGESVRVFGYNPFVIGSRREAVERFQELLTAHDADSYILNTGYVGEPSNDISLSDTTRILDAVTQDEVDWAYDTALGLDVPQEIDGVDLDALDPAAAADDPAAFDELRAERQVVLHEYDVPQAVRESV